MADSIRSLFSSDGFMPHGMCYLWRPGVLGLHVVSDSLITIAYFTIPFTLLYFVRKRTDLQFNWMFVCFAIFIVACGTTHLMEIWTIWHPAYWLSGSIKAITALASVPTAYLLMRLIPDALRVPSASALQAVNAALEREISERARAEAAVRSANAELETRVAHRTAELETTNRQLLREIGERQRADERVRSSQQLLQAVIDSSQAIIYVKDLQGRYLLANRRYEQSLGLASHSILGRTDHDIFPKDAADAFRAMDERVVGSGAPLTAEETAPQADGVHDYLSVKAPLRDDAGTMYAIVGVSTDITEGKRAEAALRESDKRNEARLRAQLERLNLLDTTTRAIAERQDLRSIFQVVLRSLEDHLPVDFACACLSEAQQSALAVCCVGAGSRALAQELDLTEKAVLPIDGNGLARCLQGTLVYEPDVSQSPFPFPSRLAHGGLRSLVIAPLIVESRVFGIVIAARRAAGGFVSGECEFLRQLSRHVALAAHQAQLYEALQTAYDDLRQSQQTIQQQERLRALGQMASGIAHDINNALSPASLYTQSLLEQELHLTRAGRESLVVIQRAIDDVAHTVARMKEFYRARDGEAPLEPVFVNQVLSQVLDLTRARWADMPQERGIVIQVATDLGANLPAVLGDDSEIRDGLTNLILNAVDAMPEGGTLTLRSRPVPGTGAEVAPSHIAVEVRDTGIGMSEQTRRRCLEPFFTTKGERGTGLGLAMVYGMTERHGAQIEIESEPGTGTTIRLVFPVAPTKAPRAATPTARRPTQCLRILLVDDDPVVLRSLQDALERDGHRISTAEGGQAGIDSFFDAIQRGEPFSAVITDLGMPYVDGRTVASAIKTRAPQTPVLMLTGWGRRLLDEHDVPAHVDRVLGKPPRLDELRRSLAELTER